MKRAARPRAPKNIKEEDECVDDNDALIAQPLFAGVDDDDEGAGEALALGAADIIGVAVVAVEEAVSIGAAVTVALGGVDEDDDVGFPDGDGFSVGTGAGMQLAPP